MKSILVPHRMVIFAAATLLLVACGHSSARKQMLTDLGEVTSDYEQGNYEEAKRKIDPLVAKYGMPARLIACKLSIQTEPPGNMAPLRPCLLPAALGNTSAVNWLGGYFEETKGFSDSLVKIRQAAENTGLPFGNKMIFFQMLHGVQYKYGWGVPKDYVQADMWFTVAATMGNPHRSGDGEILSADPAYIEMFMTADQIAEARRLAAEWMAEHETSPGD